MTVNFAVGDGFVAIGIGQNFGYFCHFYGIQSFLLVLRFKILIYGFERRFNFGDVGEPSLLFVLRPEMLNQSCLNVLNFIFSQRHYCHEHFFFFLSLQILFCISFGYFCLQNFIYNLLILRKLYCPCVFSISPL